MEIKKSYKANIEKNRSVFLKIGVILSLSFLLLAFEYKSVNTIEHFTFDNNYLGEVEKDMINVRIKPPEPPKPKIIEIKNIVPDNVEIEKELEIPESEISEEDGIELPELEIEIEDKLPFFGYEIQVQPEFPGGEEELDKFIKQNIKYPINCKENEIGGKVIVRFVVSKTGKVKNVEIAKHSDRELENEVIRVINLMPRWKPGTQNSKPVNVYFHLPIKFNIE